MFKSGNPLFFLPPPSSIRGNWLNTSLNLTPTSHTSASASTITVPDGLQTTKTDCSITVSITVSSYQDNVLDTPPPVGFC